MITKQVLATFLTFEFTCFIVRGNEMILTLCLIHFLVSSLARVIKNFLEIITHSAPRLTCEKIKMTWLYIPNTRMMVTFYVYKCSSKKLKCHDI